MASLTPVLATRCAQIDSVLEPAAEAKQRKRQATEAEIAAYMRDRTENVARVRAFVEQHNLRAADPLGAQHRGQARGVHTGFCWHGAPRARRVVTSCRGRQACAGKSKLSKPFLLVSCHVHLGALVVVLC